MTILHGIEADILRDGRIDCADDVMASLDIVLASLHEAERRRWTAADEALPDGDSASARLGHHASGRISSSVARAGYDMDYDAIYEAAAETGTALEIDGAPAHLDLDGDRTREPPSPPA